MILKKKTLESIIYVNLYSQLLVKFLSSGYMQIFRHVWSNRWCCFNSIGRESSGNDWSCSNKIWSGFSLEKVENKNLKNFLKQGIFKVSYFWAYGVKCILTWFIAYVRAELQNSCGSNKQFLILVMIVLVLIFDIGQSWHRFD